MYGGEEKCIHDLVGKPDRRKPLGEPMLDGGTLLKRILKNQDKSAWTGLILPRIVINVRIL
jgi:hypothetical protein